MSRSILNEAFLDSFGLVYRLGLPEEESVRITALTFVLVAERGWIFDPDVRQVTDMKVGDTLRRQHRTKALEGQPRALHVLKVDHYLERGPLQQVREDRRLGLDPAMELDICLYRRQVLAERPDSVDDGAVFYVRRTCTDQQSEPGAVEESRLCHLDREIAPVSVPRKPGAANQVGGAGENQLERVLGPNAFQALGESFQ
jgi:hypothetical protein